MSSNDTLVRGGACLQRVGAIALAAAGLVSALMSGHAFALPSVDWTRTNPSVIRSDTASNVTLTAKVVGGVPAQMLFAAVDGTTLTMRDDGGGGDAVAGDGIYTVLLSPALAVGGLQAVDVQRKFVGFVDVYAPAATRIARISTQTQVWTPSLGAVDIVIASNTVRYSNFVVNIVDPATFNAGPAGDFKPLINKFYQTFGDFFDFIDVVFDHGYVANRYHASVKSSVAGIGITPFNDTALYGSAGRLLGLVIYPSNTLFDAGEGTQSHEIGHQWINQLSQPTLAPAVAHWPLSTLANGVMGFTIPGSGAGGEYSCRLVPVAGGIQQQPFTGPRGFTDLDLYLMGLKPPNQVGTHYVWKDQAAATAAYNAQQCGGTTPYSSFTAIGVNDVIASDGARSPSSVNAQKDFKLAVIVVSDAVLPAEAMAFYTYFAQRAEARTPIDIHQGFIFGKGWPFYVATGGVGTLASRFRNGQVLDIDDNAKFDALTDGLLALRHMFGLTGAALNGGAVGTGAVRTNATALSNYLNGINPQLDIDGDGKTDALTDGLLILRYLFGLRGSTLVSGAVSVDATRTTQQIENYLATLVL